MAYMTNGADDAFPATTYYGEQPVGSSDGLTKREFFAALLLAGILARGGAATLSSAQAAVGGADYLIDALNAQ